MNKESWKYESKLTTRISIDMNVGTLENLEIKTTLWLDEPKKKRQNNLKY